MTVEINKIIPLRTNQKYIQTSPTTREADPMTSRIGNRKLQMEERASSNTSVCRLSAWESRKKTQQKKASYLIGSGNIFYFLQMTLGWKQGHKTMRS